jgi:hypothetical protein
MQEPVTETVSDARPTGAQGEAVAMSPRALWGIVALVCVSVGSLALAWLLPDFTLFHFLWVAQAVPVLYVFIVWWGTQPSAPPDDAPL